MGIKVAGILFALLVSLFVYSFFKVYERVELEVDTGYSREAIRNPYLAAHIFLQHLGVEVDSTSDIAALENPTPETTVLLNKTASIRSEQRMDRLLDWVSNGGQLIVAADQEDIGKRGSLIARMGLTVHWAPTRYSWFESCDDVGDAYDQHTSVSYDNTSDYTVSDALEAFNETARRQNNKNSVDKKLLNPNQCLDQKYLTEFDFATEQAPFFVHMPGNLTFEWEGDSDPSSTFPAPFFFAKDNAGVRFVQLNWGRGLITAVASPDLWRSNRIGLFDNAHLLRVLAEDTMSFQIVYGSTMPSLFTQIWRYGHLMVLLLGVLILLWIWHVSRRFQPAYEPQFTKRRNIIEHLDARADFLWHEQEYAALVEPLKADLLARCHVLIPGFNQASNETKINMVAGVSGLNREAVERIFSDVPYQDSVQCRRAIEISRQIRNSL